MKLFPITMKLFPITIRARTAAAACLVVGMTFAATAGIFVITMRRSLDSTLTGAARVRAEELALLVQKTKLPSVLPDSGEKGAVVQVVDGVGRILAASAQIIEGSRLSMIVPKLGQTRTESRTSLPITGDQTGDPFRVLSFGAQTARGPITVYVGISLDPVNETVWSVKKLLLVALPTLLLVVGFTSWYFVGRALRPVDLMRHQVGEMGDDDLSQRLPEPPVDDEIGRLARGMNLMLNRLQSSTDRQRRFIADASHELQSPLASSLADLEVAIRHPDDVVWDDLVHSLVADNQRMSKLVGDLLFLAKSDNNANRVSFVDVDLDDVVRVEVARLPVREGVHIDATGVTPVEVRGDHDQLARVVRNLLENAERHATSVVSVQVTREKEQAILLVSDNGPGIPVDAYERIFERFTRLDDSRSRHSGGSGLGLPIAKEIIDSHGGDIAVQPSVVGATFVVRLSALPH